MLNYHIHINISLGNIIKNLVDLFFFYNTRYNYNYVHMYSKTGYIMNKNKEKYKLVFFEVIYSKLTG